MHPTELLKVTVAPVRIENESFTQGCLIVCYRAIREATEEVNGSIKKHKSALIKLALVS
ncbi:hypothetical protein ACPCXA_21570 [Lysinibacillus agricola]